MPGLCWVVPWCRYSVALPWSVWLGAIPWLIISDVVYIYCAHTQQHVTFLLFSQHGRFDSDPRANTRATLDDSAGYVVFTTTSRHCVVPSSSLFDVLPSPTVFVFCRNLYLRVLFWRVPGLRRWSFRRHGLLVPACPTGYCWNRAARKRWEQFIFAFESLLVTVKCGVLYVAVAVFVYSENAEYVHFMCLIRSGVWDFLLRFNNVY